MNEESPQKSPSELLAEYATDLEVAISVMSEELQDIPKLIKFSSHSIDEKITAIRTINTLFRLAPANNAECSCCGKIPSSYEIWKKVDGKLTISEDGDPDTIHDSLKLLENVIVYDNNEILKKCPRCNTPFSYRKVKDGASINLFLLKSKQLECFEYLRDFYVENRQGQLYLSYNGNKNKGEKEIEIPSLLENQRHKKNIRDNIILILAGPILAIFIFVSPFGSHSEYGWLWKPLVLLTYGTSLYLQLKDSKKQKASHRIRYYQGKITRKEIRGDDTYAELDDSAVYQSLCFDQFAIGDTVEIFISKEEKAVMDVVFVGNEKQVVKQKRHSSPIPGITANTNSFTVKFGKDDKFKIRSDLFFNFLSSGMTWILLALFVPLFFSIVMSQFNYAIPFVVIMAILFFYGIIQSYKHMRDLWKGEKSVEHTIVQDKFTDNRTFRRSSLRKFPLGKGCVIIVNGRRIEIDEPLYDSLAIGSAVSLETAPRSGVLLDVYFGKKNPLL